MQSLFENADIENTFTIKFTKYKNGFSDAIVIENDDPDGALDVNQIIGLIDNINKGIANGSIDTIDDDC